MGLLTGTTALITGAARGIGKAIALKFASEGADIAFTDLVIDEEHGGAATEREISALGVKVNNRMHKQGFPGLKWDKQTELALGAKVLEMLIAGKVSRFEST